MGLLDEARNASPRQPWQMCGVVWVALLLEDDIAAEWWQAVDDLTIQAGALAKTVQGYISPAKVSADAIRRHRRGVCSCEKAAA